MKDFFIRPLRLAREEIKKNKQLIKRSEDKKLKMTLRSFIYMSYMFMIVLLILYVAVLYYLIAGIFVSPFGFIGIIPNGIMSCIGILMYTKIYPKTRANALKGIGFDEEKLSKLE